jgi:hypothetical protein
MTDQQVIESVRAACVAGDLQTLLDLIKPIARLSKSSLATAKTLIRERFDTSRVPRRLFNSAIKTEREAFLRSERDHEMAKDFAALSGSRIDPSILRRKDPHAVDLGRRGGLVRGIRKGLACLPPDRRAEIQAKAIAGIKRAKAQRDAVRTVEAARVMGGC